VTNAVIESTTCRNCGAVLHGPFCATCGQEDRPLDPTLSEVAGEVAREISSLDGRILRSVRRLFFSPGFLTIEHFRGRRVAWVSPVRLYLVFSVAYFAIASFTGSSPLDVNLRLTGSTSEENTEALRRLHFSSEEEMQRSINQALTTWIPRAMFVLVPVFGWLVSRVRRRSGHRYPHHVIFALHVFGAFFGAQVLAVALGYAAGSDRVAAAAGVASLLYAVTYMVLAMRKVYGGTIARAVAHTMVVLLFYWLATAAVAAAIVVPVLFLAR
jgi:dolichol kinase